MNKLHHALALADLGFHVFPIEAGAKSPPHIDDFPTKASMDLSDIRKWWRDPVMGWERDFNIGISTSRFAADEALLVVDIDNKGDKHGDKTIYQLEAAGHIFPVTVETRTPTGGRHLIYRTPHAVRQGANVLGEGVDIRSWGGYVVGPGSDVREGEYTVTTGGRPVPAPPWLVAACGLRETSTAQRGRGDSGVRAVASASGQRHAPLNEDRALRRAQEYLQSLDTVVEGERNHQCFKVANRLKDLGVGIDDATGLLRDHWKCEPMLDDAELELAVGSAYRATKTAPGSAAPESQFSVVPAAVAVPGDWLQLLLDFCS